MLPSLLESTRLCQTSDIKFYYASSPAQNGDVPRDNASGVLLNNIIMKCPRVGAVAQRPVLGVRHDTQGILQFSLQFCVMPRLLTPWKALSCKVEF